MRGPTAAQALSSTWLPHLSRASEAQQPYQSVARRVGSRQTQRIGPPLSLSETHTNLEIGEHFVLRLLTQGTLEEGLMCVRRHARRQETTGVPGRKNERHKRQSQGKPMRGKVACTQTAGVTGTKDGEEGARGKRWGRNTSNTAETVRDSL